MKKSFIFTFITLLVLCSCSTSKYYVTDSTLEIDEGNAATSLKGELLMKSSNTIAHIFATDQYLVVVQSCKDTLFKVIDINKDTVIASFGQLGHSKNEFLDIPYFSYIKTGKDKKPLLFIQEKGYTKVVDLEKSISSNNCIIKEKIKEEVEPIYYRKFYIDTTKAFMYKNVSCIDAREFKREKPEFSLLHTNKIIKKWDIFPCMIDYDDPSFLTSEYDGIMTFKPDGTKSAFIMYMIDILTYFDLNNYETKGIINNSSYSFNNLNDLTKENIDQELIIYNMDACSSNNYIYILKDGRPYQKMLDSTDTRYPSALNVFDWNGNKIASSTFDRSLTEIEYSNKFKTLYGLSIDRDAIYKYKSK